MVITIARAYLGSEYELEMEEEEDALIAQRCHGPLADCRCYGVQSRYLSSITSDLMFRFGHISEWWWRLTRFAPGKPPLLPLDIRRKSKTSDIYVPWERLGENNILPTHTGSATSTCITDDRIDAIINTRLQSFMQELVSKMDGIISARVADGITEAHSRYTVNSSSSSTNTESVTSS